jgi:hypothetical protein
MYTVIRERSHGWRIKALKMKVVKVETLTPWTPGSHNCGAAKRGGCFCSGACMQEPKSFLQTIGAGYQHHAALAEDDKTRVG